VVSLSFEDDVDVTAVIYCSVAASQEALGTED